MKYVIQILFLFGFSVGSTQTLEKCLIRSNETTAPISHCAAKYIKNLTPNSCFAQSEKIRSPLSKENLKQFCFYQISDFPSLKSCLMASEKMTVAINHDEAIFECIRQFQDQINPANCQQISGKLRYAEKSQYLRRRCNQL